MTAAQWDMYLDVDDDADNIVTFPDVASAQAYLAKAKRDT